MGIRLVRNCSYFLSSTKCSISSGRRFIMTTNNNSKDHIEVTKDSTRSSSIHDAIVDQIFDISPTVKQVVLKVKEQDDEPFNFLTGQWLDLIIPGVKTVGGFSITSIPKQLTSFGTLNFAVKYSDWPPAHWIHTQCQKDSKVTIRSGGDFILPKNPNGDYLFVAGGVGINPIMSMIFHLVDLQYPYNILLVYTAKSVAELLFRDQFNELANLNSNFQVKYFVTSQEVTANDKNSGHNLPSFQYESRRIVTADLDKFMTADKTTFVCGPPALMQLTMQNSHRCKEIHFEKWWM